MPRNFSPSGLLMEPDLRCPQQHFQLEKGMLVGFVFFIVVPCYQESCPNHKVGKTSSTLTCSKDTKILCRFPLVSPLTSDSRLLSNTFEKEKRKGRKQMI